MKISLLLNTARYGRVTFHTKIIFKIIRGISNLSQGTYFLQNFTDEGLIFCQLEMRNHFHVIMIEGRIISKRKRPFWLFWETKQKMNLNEVSTIRGFLFKNIYSIHKYGKDKHSIIVISY